MTEYELEIEQMRAYLISIYEDDFYKNQIKTWTATQVVKTLNRDFVGGVEAFRKMFE